MSLDDFALIGPLCYQGKEGCEDVRCRRQYLDGAFGPCMGWHCSYCDEPCGMMGHRCDASEAILAEARRLAAAASPEGHA